MEKKIYSHQQLKSFSQNIFLQIGCDKQQAAIAATALLSADLRGVDSHGVARLSGYVRLWEAGRINVNPDIKIVHETPSTAVVDGDSGLGLVVAPVAMQLAIQKAAQCGTGWVSVKNSNHFGIAGYHAMQALQHDMIGIAMTNASPLVAPVFSKERMLGTNPIAVAIPAGKQPPFVADFATTTAANGKLEMLQRQNKNAPDGWLQDKDGKITNDPHALKQGGALLPLGGEDGGHKGYCLGAIVDIFSAVLSGAAYGPWAPPFVSFLSLPPDTPDGAKGLGHFFGAMRIDAFRPAKEFKKHIDNWINRFRKASIIEGKDRVMIPGDPEREMEKIRLQKGIPLLPAVEEDLQNLAKKFDLLF